MKLLLADDHHLFRDAIVALLEDQDPTLDVVHVQDLDAALACLQAASDFDGLLLDLWMPGMNGMRGVERVRTAYPDLPVILLSGFATAAEVKSALGMGIAGYLPKTLPGRDLASSIRDILKPGNRSRPVPAMYHGEGFDPGRMRLSAREIEIVGLLREGYTNKEIAMKLAISPETVKAHIKSATHKTNARNRTEVVVMAIERGLI